MVQINFAQRQVNAKIVYYGPGMSGKTTNLEIVHQRAPSPNRGDLTSISTDGDRTLFFDFMPLDLGTVAGMRTCFQIYTVPGQVYYNSTRKLVLQGVDGVVFVADSSASMVEENLESMRNLEQNLAEYGKTLAQMPLIIQYNKRDLPDAMSVEELNKILNPYNAPFYEAIANTGQGVFPTLKALAARVLESIHTGAKTAATGGGTVSGQTGFYPLVNPNGGQPPTSAPQRMHQTGFHQAPAAHAQPQTNPPRPLLQTGFHQAPAAQAPVNAPRPMQPQAPAMPMMQQPSHPGQMPGLVQQGHMQPGHADPMARTSIHAPPPSIPLPPMLGQPGMMQQPQQQMPQPGFGYAQPAAPQPFAPANVAMMPPQQQPQQPTVGGGALHMMRVDKGHGGAPGGQQAHAGVAPAAKTRPLPSAPRPPTAAGASSASGTSTGTNAGTRAAPRLQPRAAPLPTPNAGGKKWMMYLGIFLVVALGLGAVVAKLVLKLF
jgi:signal recognition particle receptor subunit beta